MSRWHEVDAWALAFAATAGIYAAIFAVVWALRQVRAWALLALCGLVFVGFPLVWVALRHTVLK